MNIFLSGKVDDKHGQWRDHLLGTDDHYNQERHQVEHLPRWAIYTTALDSRKQWKDNIGILPWPVKSEIVLDTHDYTGPFRQVVTDYDEPKNLGYFHGSTGSGSHGQMERLDQRAVVSRCLMGIDQSDMVFAYINSEDCYGTLVEIGYAHARGKPITLATASDMEFMPPWDCWFADTFAAASVGRQDNETESAFLRRAMLEGISAAMGRPRMPSPVSIAVSALTNIEKWTADPRVRAEAEKTLTVLRRM
jgi:hypothetical protein